MTELDPDYPPNNMMTLRKICFITIFLLCFVICAFAGWYYVYTVTLPPASSGEEVIVTIPKGSSLKAIKKILSDAGLIRDDFRFLLLAKFSGLSKRLQAGEFKLKGGVVPGEILLSLATSRPVQYSVTIPEGLSAAEIASIFEEAGFGNSKNFLNLINDRELIEEVGLGGLSSLEGYLFPDTYLFSADGKNAEAVIKKMIHRFHLVWSEISDGITPLPDREKIVILASIVEEETGSAEERGLIAGVFLNRLRLGMRLQSDPTVLYGVEDSSVTITKKHLRTPTPYNTYVIAGLPVGPISNPGADAIRAVLFPQKSNNLYFVSKNDGTHHFSATLKEHNRAVVKYQRKKADKKGK